MLWPLQFSSSPSKIIKYTIVIIYTFDYLYFDLLICEIKHKQQCLYYIYSHNTSTKKYTYTLASYVKRLNQKSSSSIIKNALAYMKPIIQFYRCLDEAFSNIKSMP